MRLVTKAGAWCNGEVAYLAWDVDARIEGCLGFMITRVHETGRDAGQRRNLPTWVAFTDQSNPDWNEQDTSVWPIQRFEWRDLTLRKSRDSTDVRPIGFRAHYEIVPVGALGPGGAIPPSTTAPATTPSGRPSFVGPAHPLSTIGEPTRTNAIDVTHDYGGDGPTISATFTNGILSTQNLVRQLQSVGLAPGPAATHGGPATAKAREDRLLTVLKREIVEPTSKIRAFLTADVFGFLTRLLDRAEKDGGDVYAALYELHDPELIRRLVAFMPTGRLHLILSTAGNVDPNPKGAPKEARKPVVWDTTNNAARASLRAVAAGPLADRLIDRMFDTSSRIGHNKFAVLVQDGKAVAVMTGSTNWTETGLCTQSNNVVVIEDEALAGDYLAYWQALEADEQPARMPAEATDAHGQPIVGAAPNSAKQGRALRDADAAGLPERALAGAGVAKLWRAPNTRQISVPKTATPVRPPDLEEVYGLMESARDAVFFLTFLPGYSGRNNVIGKAQELAGRPGGPLVLGAASDPAALPPPADGSSGSETYVDGKGRVRKLPPPSIWWPAGENSRIAMISASRIPIRIGDLQPELLTAGHAIIHDKIIVIDPCDADRCAVITGSHNLGYKASYANDENMLVIQRNRALAISYAVHVLDLYDHYVFRARLERTLRERLKRGEIHDLEDASETDPHGFLRLNDRWQDTHFAPRPRSSLDYFLAHAAASSTP